MTKKEIFSTVKGVLVAALLFVALGVAGHFDREDEVICEMKNNGAYWELSEQHPQATDAELVKMYEAEEEVSEQCPD